MNIYKLASFALLGCIGLTSLELKACSSVDSEELPSFHPILVRQNAQIFGSDAPQSDTDVQQDSEPSTGSSTEKLNSKGFSALRASFYYWLKESTQKHYSRKTRNEAKERAKDIFAEITERFPGEMTSQIPTEKQPKKKMFLKNRRADRAAKESFLAQDSE